MRKSVLFGVPFCGCLCWQLFGYELFVELGGFASNRRPKLQAEIYLSLGVSKNGDFLSIR